MVADIDRRLWDFSDDSLSRQFSSSRESLSIQPLRSEGGLDSVSAEDIAARERLCDQFRALPEEALTRMHYLQPQIGCPNRCGFCSQSAGTDSFQLDRRNLKNLLSALKTVGTEIRHRRGQKEGPLVGSERQYKPGVIYPYIDNDSGSYRHLLEYIGGMYDDLGCKVRLTTVGYSRHNKDLQAMHEQINARYPEAIESIRFSFTPYTHGFTMAAEQSGSFSRQDYIEDFANTINTYRPLIEHRPLDKDRACVALRFKPHVETEEKALDDEVIDGHHCVHIGPYLLVSAVSGQILPETHVVGIVGNQPQYSQQAQEYLLLRSDNHIAQGNWQEEARSAIRIMSDPEQLGVAENTIKRTTARVLRLSNEEGPYYAVNPDFTEDGEFEALYIYAQTDKREKSGYINAERYFLNALLRYKRDRGVGRREEFESATWDDVRNVVDVMEERVNELTEYDVSSAVHLRDHVIPMIKAYALVLQKAGFEPAYFFSRNFTVDTGQIVNQGRAIHEFRGLTATLDLPLNPREESRFGAVSTSTEKGTVWRWAPNPTPVTEEHITRAAKGRKNVIYAKPSMTVSKLDLRNFSTVTPEGKLLPSYTIEGVDIERVSVKRSAPEYLLPGVKVASPTST